VNDFNALQAVENKLFHNPFRQSLLSHFYYVPLLGTAYLQRKIGDHPLSSGALRAEVLNQPITSSSSLFQATLSSI